MTLPPAPPPSARPRLPADWAWHQSSVALMLRCPRAFRLRYVAQVPRDHRSSGYAAILGTADHAGLELILQASGDGRVPSRAQLRDCVMDGFACALERAQAQGEQTEDPEAAVEALEGVRLDRLCAVAEDPRIHAVDWRGIEWRFELTNRGLAASGRAWRRRWRGTVDAWGTAKTAVREFGWLDHSWAPLAQGDRVVLDWKTGAMTPLGRVPLAANVQLGIYTMALSRTHGAAPWRAYIAQVPDVDRPKLPKDASGVPIPKRLARAANPAYAKACGLGLGQPLDARADDAWLTAIKACRRRPRDADGEPIVKWLPDQLNPAWEAATQAAKGPLLREAQLNYPLIVEAVTSAIRQAEVGLFPASGALTGQCTRCDFSAVCTARTDPEATEEEAS